MTSFWITPENSKAFGLNGSGVPAMIAVGGSSTLAGLSDVAISGLADLDLLQYNAGTGKYSNIPGSTYLTLTAGNAAYQPLSSTLTTLSSATAAGLALMDDASATAQRTTLGLGTISTQAASSVSITGGSMSGMTISARSLTVIPQVGSEPKITFTSLNSGGSAILEFPGGGNSPTYQLRSQATGGTLISTGDTGTVTNAMLAGSIALSKITTGNHKLFYSNGSGVIQELALGDSGKVLTSNGASAAPTFETPSGGGAAIEIDQAAWIETDGVDATGTLGDPAKPYQTMQEAYNDGARTFYCGVGSFAGFTTATSIDIKVSGHGRATIIDAITSTDLGGGAITITDIGHQSCDIVQIGSSSYGHGSGTENGVSRGAITLYGVRCTNAIYGIGGGGGNTSADGDLPGSGGSGALLYLYDCEVAAGATTIDLSGGNGGSSTASVFTNGGSGGAAGSVTFRNSRVFVNVTAVGGTGGSGATGGSAGSDGSDGNFEGSHVYFPAQFNSEGTVNGAFVFISSTPSASITTVASNIGGTAYP